MNEAALTDLAATVAERLCGTHEHVCVALIRHLAAGLLLLEGLYCWMRRKGGISETFPCMYTHMVKKRSTLPKESIMRNHDKSPS